MPRRSTVKRARKAKREGKSPSTQAGEFVRQEIRDIRKGEHGARSTKQAIAIGLSKARRAGVKLEAPKKGTASTATRKKAKRDLAKGRAKKKTRPDPERSRAARKALRREGTSAASRESLSRHARTVARRKPKAARSRAARRAATTRSNRSSS